MTISNFDTLLNFLENKSILITSHDITDLDGFVSSLLFKELLKYKIKYKNLTIVFSEISKNTRKFIDRFTSKFKTFKFEVKHEIDYSKYNVLMVMDTNNLDLVKITQTTTFDLPLIFIDHHFNLKKDYEQNIQSLNLINEEFSSTTEIVYKMMCTYDLNISLPFKYLIISAILTDSGFLRHSTTNTIRNIVQILGDTIEIQDIFTLFNNDNNEIPEKIARIKGLQRVKLIRFNHFLIGITHVSSFGAMVASLLLNIGFDIGIVYSKDKDTFRITTRARKSICMETGLHLGKILNEMKHGSSGGHDGAATFNGKVDIDEFLELLLEKIKKTLIISRS